jgi:hypothetical protein
MLTNGRKAPKRSALGTVTRWANQVMGATAGEKVLDLDFM